MNRITGLFHIQYPVIQAGMIWCSGWELAAAVSNGGGLGLIGSGSMDPEELAIQVRNCKKATNNPFGVNIPLLYEGNEEKFRILAEEGVKIIFTSAGNPVRWTPLLKKRGFTVVHVVANVKSARKCMDAGVDAIVAEGFEAGGHNGKEETTTMALIPMVRREVDLPLIAAGGIATGRAMLAAFALGAEGVQIGSRFVASAESSAHPDFKRKIIESADGDTFLSLKKLVPVRLLKNKFALQAQEMEQRGASAEELAAFLGRGRARKGMLEGDLEEGELEIGQVSGLIREIKPAAEILMEIISEFNEARDRLAEVKI
jgi:enoyl-[acyl-carrier protein] reductase II